MPERGRPTVYTPEVAEEICRRLAEGESLTRICRDEHLPAESTVRGWALDDREGFYAEYTRARQVQAHRMFDETLEIADFGLNDTYEDEDGHTKTDHDVIARSKLRVDTRKWYLSKVLPKVYGDKTHLEHSGKVDGGVLMIPAPVSPEEWAKAAEAQQAELAKHRAEAD